MRASRLLQILLLLQNRGRLTAAALARELEVAHRTVLRDMDALTEAGLPIIAFQGNQGGFELGFDYRTRLTGLDDAEAEALAIILDAPSARLAALGLEQAGRRAVSKMRESLPDRVRHKLSEASARFPYTATPGPPPDARLPALAQAIRRRVKVRLAARTSSSREIHPIGLEYDGRHWAVRDALTLQCIPMDDWKDINISAISFQPVDL